MRHAPLALIAVASFSIAIACGGAPPDGTAAVGQTEQAIHGPFHRSVGDPGGSGSSSSSVCTNGTTETNCYLNFAGTGQCCVTQRCMDCEVCDYNFGFGWCSTQRVCDAVPGSTTCQ